MSVAARVLPWLFVSMLAPVATSSAEAIRATPTYTTASIVNAATNVPGPLAPLALVSLYGKDLAFVTRGLTGDDIRNGLLPTTLIGTGVTVLIDNVAIPVLFVSPNQINFLIPANIRTGRRPLRVALNGKTGPEVDIQIADNSPGLFPMDDQRVIATRPDGSLLTPDAPAFSGEILVLYAAGLGLTQPSFTGLTLPNIAASITARRDFALLLNDEAIPDDHILYAGVTPGFAGLYQVNFRVPDTAPPDPEIRLRLPGAVTPQSLRLPLRTVQ